MRTRQLTKHFCDSALWLFVAGATTLLGGQAKPEVIPGLFPAACFESRLAETLNRHGWLILFCFTRTEITVGLRKMEGRNLWRSSG